MASEIKASASARLAASTEPLCVVAGVATAQPQVPTRSSAAATTTEVIGPVPECLVGLVTLVTTSCPMTTQA
jgi:hypothetical protein